MWTRATAQPWTRSRSTCSARPRSTGVLLIRDGARLAAQFEAQQRILQRVQIRIHFLVNPLHHRRRVRGGRRSLCLRGALRLAAFRSGRGAARHHFGDRLAQQQGHAHGKNGRKSAEKNPLLIAEARRGGFNCGFRAGSRGRSPDREARKKPNRPPGAARCPKSPRRIRRRLSKLPSRKR